jgi:hypothetical protein
MKDGEFRNQGRLQSDEYDILISIYRTYVRPKHPPATACNNGMGLTLHGKRQRYNLVLPSLSAWIWLPQRVQTKQVGAPTVPSTIIKCQFCYWSNVSFVNIYRSICHFMSLSDNFVIGQIMTFLSFYFQSYITYIFVICMSLVVLVE